DNAAFISQGESFSFIDGNGGLWLELDSALTHVADNVVDAASNLMLKKDGTVWIYSDRTNSVSVYDRIDNVVSIAASDDLFAAVKANGSLYTFMDDADSYPEFIADNVKTVYSSYNYPDAHVRFNYMAFIKNDGSLWMWGRNDWDKINAEPYHFETPVKVMDNVVSASLGGNTSTALTADGTVWEWGEYTQSSAPKIVMDGIKLPGDITPITPIAPEQPATPAQPTAPPAAPIQPATPGITVSPTASEVFVNGVSKSFEAYNIEGSNYFKLRDLAFVVSGTAKQFNVGYDGATQAITITTGQPYVPAGGEMTMGDGSAKTAEPTASRIYLDGAELNPTVYNIGGNNFFNLVDMVSALNIGVTYNETTGAIGIDTNANFMGVVTVSGEQPIVPPPVNYADTPTPEPTLPPPVEMPVPTPAPVPATPNVNNEENYVRSEFSVDLDENNNPVEIYGVEIFFKGVKPDIQQSDITDITLTLNGKAVAIDGFDVTKMFVEDEETGATHTSYFLMIYPWFADSGTYSFSCKILGVECSTGAFNL
ncbi:MAG: hypothetical protein LBR83_06550, partial [Clostridiales bacterium]|nr:hypothetical protein [Clostridiales bacterium]